MSEPVEDMLIGEPTWVEMAGVRLEGIATGEGRPILFLHSEAGFASAKPAIRALARHGKVFAPAHPGFGRSDLPASFDHIDDLAYFYLDLLDERDLREVVLIGCGFGGWIAAEIAVKSCAHLSHLVLIDAVGIKTEDRIADIFALTAAELREASYHEPEKAPPALGQLSDAELTIAFRDRETLARFGWSPYMHDPKVLGRLHRIQVPSLVLWGTQDRIVSPDYGRAYAAAIPNARFAVVDDAGHFPEIERPDAVAARIAEFVKG